RGLEYSGGSFGGRMSWDGQAARILNTLYLQYTVDGFGVTSKKVRYEDFFGGGWKGLFKGAKSP
ncbi:MAG: hypothetical protein AAF591_11695, partial [Verrucomicrobiota bacterium]